MRSRHSAAVLTLAMVCNWATFASADDVKPGAATDFTLRLAEFAFDPLETVPELEGGWDRSKASQPDLHLVQFDGVTKAGSLAKLKAEGLETVQYIYPYTYIVWGRQAQRKAVEHEDFVRWTGDFAPAYRVQPQWRNLKADCDVRVLIYRGAGAEGVIASIEAMGARLHGSKVLNEKFEIVNFSVPGDGIRKVANIPGVYSISLQPTDGGLRGEMSNQVNANNVDGTNAAFSGYEAWLAGLGLTGAGIVIANVDGGVDDTHPDLSGRMLPCIGSTCSGTSSGHGTHTAGTMAADGSSGTLDAFGFLRGLGVAPGAQLVEQLYNPTFTQPGGMLILIQQSRANGAILSGNSWGPAGTPQGYDDDTMQVDIGVRDSAPGTPGNQQLHYILSFMNGNGGVSSQGSPDEAKNLFTIGSTKMQTGAGTQDLEINDLSANTAHGPARDGRMIPHMVAPGCQVDSTEPGGGYGLRCGTSMASPHVSGAVALFIEYYRGLPDYVLDPSPALVKAAFLAVARNLRGNQDADGGTLGNPFDSKQGWGRLDLEAVIDPVPDSVRYFDDPLILDTSADEWVESISPLDPGKPVRIMLAWTDAPGHGLGGTTPAWNNNLDLVVEAGGDTFLGNNFGANGLSVTGGSADVRNNTEGVFISPPVAADVTIRVVGTNINSDGIPGFGDSTDQDFAVACYNCAVEPSFRLSPVVAEAAICAPQAAVYEIDVEDTLGFVDPVTLSAIDVPAGATSSFSSNPVSPPGMTTFTVDNTGAASPGSYTIMIDGDAGALHRSVNLQLKIDNAVPTAVVPTSPADGATDVSVTPTFAWNATGQATGYHLDIATDAGFSGIVYTIDLGETSHPLPLALNSVTTYFWRVRASNSCGTGSFSATRSFSTLNVPPILLVDDDDNGPDVRAAYIAALDALGAVYDIWDTNNSDNEPTAVELAPYRQVIWFTGDEFGGVSGPGPNGEAALSAWLLNRGCLLVSSQDYYWDRGLTSLMTDYLGVFEADSDVGQTVLTGSGTFAGLGPFTASFPYPNYTDIITPDGTAELAFSGDLGNAGVSKNAHIYRTSFWGFGLEILPTAQNREETLGAFLGWCDTLPTDDGDLDGVANGDDCSPADATIWSKPGPATDLRISRAVVDNISWTSPLNNGGIDPIAFDVVRSTDPADFSTADCADSGIAGNLATDASEPGAGSCFYYLIRSVNSCGGELGTSSGGLSRPDADVCP